MKLLIKEVAKAKGITLQEIGQRLGSSKQVISGIARHGNPTIQTLEKIAEVLGCRIADLFEETDDGTIECPVCGSLIDLRTGTRLPSSKARNNDSDHEYAKGDVKQQPEGLHKKSKE